MAHKHLMVLGFVFLGLFSMSVFTERAFPWGSLKSKIQEELDISPFLQREGVKLRVVDEKSGYVTIEMYEGDPELMKAIHDGIDVFSSQIDLMFHGVSRESRASLNALRRTIDYVKKIEGVKEVLLTAAHDPMDLVAQADKLYFDKLDKKVEQAIPLYRQAAETGYAEAQIRLGQIYLSEEGYRDYLAAETWLRKAADQGKIEAMNNLAWLYATCKDAKLLDGAKAVIYAQKGLSQEPNDPCLLDSLAAAYARSNKFQDAVLTQEKAISLFQNWKGLSDEQRRELLPGFRERLNLYKNRQAYISTHGTD
ncbi:MAG: tetratricopeptide repeat protein [Cyanobacteriota bacterium]